MDLVTPPSGAQGELRDGSVLRADMSSETIQLYQAFNRIYDLLSQLQPAQLDAALSAVAEVLRGRGGDLGTTIAELDILTHQLQPALRSVGPNLRALATLSEQLSSSAPDAFHALDDAVSISETIVAKQQSLRSLLGAGTSLAQQSNQLLGNNSSRIIQLVRLTGPPLDALASQPGQISRTLTDLHTFLNKGSQVFSSGRLKLQAPIIFPPPAALHRGRLPALSGTLRAELRCGRTEGRDRPDATARQPASRRHLRAGRQRAGAEHHRRSFP